MEWTEKEKYDVEDLRRVVALLRSEDGCPWDKVQTHESIRRNLIEEAYEAAEAIDKKDVPHLREELGDVLMQVVFHSGIEEDAEHFDLNDVADTACKKLIRRHPTLFTSGEAGNDSTFDAWEAVKRTEREDHSVLAALMDIPTCMPALWRAEKLQRKGGRAGYPLPERAETCRELMNAVSRLRESDSPEDVQKLLFLAVRLAAILEVDPEDALNAASADYIKAFGQYEKEKTK